MPKADYQCNSIIFNGNILISGRQNGNLLLYSIDIDSFSTIPYKFNYNTRKILINVERLYLIECDGSIYESEIGSYSNLMPIGKSTINCIPDQVYCSYNKGGIYTPNIKGSCKEYYYFNLDQKIIIDVAYYNTHVSLRRVGKKIEAIKWNNQNFKLDPYVLDECNVKDITLKYLGENLESIECYDEAIKLKPNDFNNYWRKDYAFYHLKRYQEAIECYDEAIKLNPNEADFYKIKGDAFLTWQRYLEAIECYGKAIKINPNNHSFYNCKGNAFNKLKRYLEAIECYDKAIGCYNFAAKRSNDEILNIVDIYNNKGTAFYYLERYLEAIESFDKAIKCFKKAFWLNAKSADSHYKKGCSLNKLGRYLEALESYDEAIRYNWKNAKYYNERFQEAIECYDGLIEFEPNNPLHFCSRARVFNHLRQEEAALQDLNTAYNLKQKNQANGVFTGEEWNLSEDDINFINDSLGRDRIEILQKMQV